MRDVLARGTLPVGQQDHVAPHGEETALEQRVGFELALEQVDVGWIGGMGRSGRAAVIDRA
jgi:hypothetical protein